MYERPGYHADATILYGTQVENTDLFPQQAELAGEWNSCTRIRGCNTRDFMRHLTNIAQQFGDDIPTMSGDGGPYWEDGIASDAYYAAMERENESRGPSAEKLATHHLAGQSASGRRQGRSGPDVDQHGADG